MAVEPFSRLGNNLPLEIPFLESPQFLQCPVSESGAREARCLDATVSGGPEKSNSMVSDKESRSALLRVRNEVPANLD